MILPGKLGGTSPPWGWMHHSTALARRADNSHSLWANSGASPGLDEGLAPSPVLNSPRSPCHKQDGNKRTPLAQAGPRRPQRAPVIVPPPMQRKCACFHRPGVALNSAAEGALVPPLPRASGHLQGCLPKQFWGLESFSWHFSEATFCPGQSGRFHGGEFPSPLLRSDFFILTNPSWFGAGALTPGCLRP